MRAYRITDYRIPIMILQDEVIASTIYEDGAEFMIPDILREYWVGVSLADSTIACFRTHQYGRITWQQHGRILPQFRKKAVEATILSLKWSAKNIPEFHNMMAYVPECHPNVAKHLLKCGFTLTGVLPESYLRDGKIVGQDIFYITKEEIEKL